MHADNQPSAVLASFAVGLDYDDLPPATVAAAKRSILDTIGCALHGSTLPWGRMIQDVIATDGGIDAAGVWGTALRAPIARAALANATAGHSFELDDVHMGGMIHTGSLALPVALAVGEERGLDGGSLLAAVVAGAEVGARVGRAVGTGHFRAGFHPQGTVGVFAAAAAAGRSAGVDAPTLQQALGIAGSRASGLMAAQEGAMVKRLHSGWAAETGVSSVQLAQRGFTGIPDVFEAEFGGFASALGGDSVDLSLLTAKLGDVWETEQIGFKAHASCAAAHTSLDVVGRLRAENALDADAVRGVTIHASTHAVVHCGWTYQGAGVTEAQMSIPYGVARMLLDGAVNASQFSDVAIADPRAIELASRVAVVPDEAIDALGPARRYTVRVEIETRDGRMLLGDASDRIGSPGQPLSDAQLEEKFRGLAEPVVGASAARIREIVATLENLPDVRELADLLRCAT